MTKKERLKQIAENEADILQMEKEAEEDIKNGLYSPVTKIGKCACGKCGTGAKKDNLLEMKKK